MSLRRSDVSGLRALVARLRLVRHLRALVQGDVTLSLDGAVVDEQILAAVLGRDEAEALVGVEPLNCSGWHFASTVMCWPTRRMLTEQQLRQPALLRPDVCPTLLTIRV